MISVIPQPTAIVELEGTSTAPVTLVPSTAHGAEGYELTVTPDAVTLVGSPAGQFYGQQTLRQLRADNGSIPCCRISDRPRFSWRGLMVDVARHFFSKDELKHFLDVMAAHKLNVFHWHLVDDQGWRVEIKQYPRLTEVGAWRDGIGFGLDPGSTRHYRADGRYGGFYTQDDIREIVAYAAERHITIVPEIEMPGHSTAALAAYPALSCTGRACSPATSAGVMHGVYCAGQEATFEFLENILSEVIGLFPGPFIHIGGDEVPKDNWKACPRCQQRIAAEGLQNEDEIQSYFIRRIERFLNAHGRRLIGWDEILEGGLAPHATVMSWHGVKGGIAAANAGHDVVMTPVSHCYFDAYQSTAGHPLAAGWIKPIIPVERVYEFDPIPPEIALDKAHHILGGGANLWTEFMPNYGHLQFMAWPRACALAEVLWSAPGRRQLDDFLKRLKNHERILRALGVLYARTVS
jgi:hexosaminidase